MKNILLIVLVFIICAAAYLFFFAKPATPLSVIPTAPTSTTPSVAQSPVPVSPNFGNVDVGGLGNFSNTSTGATISFKFTPNPMYGRNDVDDLYVGKNKIGEVDGQEASVVGFSPDKNYFAVETVGLLGGENREFGVSIIDLKNSKLLNFGPKIESGHYASNQFKDIDLEQYIDSVSWSGSSSLDISSYYLWPDYNDVNHTNAYSRVSPEETWRYDLLTGSSTLIQTIP